jgi:hypothetical protein
MRTTLTLDPDVAVEIERRRREHGTSLKQEVNQLLRVGLRAVDEPKPAEPYRLPTFDLGKPRIPIDNLDYALRMAEGDDYK